MKITTSAILATALLISASSATYAGTEFYYQSYGGFVENQHAGDGFRFKPGADDTTQDGPWYREGPFSHTVQFGDQNSSQPIHNLKDSRDPNGAFPALAWGHVEEDPFMSEGGQGDDVGGASGVGLIGYGYEDAVKKGGRKLKVGEKKIFYPFGAAQHHNYFIHFSGSMSTKVSWNLELYDKKGNPVYKNNYLFDMNMWETVNFNLTPNDCPRTVISALGAPMTDSEFNANQNTINSHWPTTGLDFLFYGDGHPDASSCADAFGYTASTGEDHFTVTDKKGKTKDYTVTFDGFYTYLPDAKGCPPLDSGLYNVPKDNKDAAWKMECFKKTPTFWSDEYKANTGYIRLAITEDKKDKDEETGCLCKDIKDITSLTMTWDGDKNTTVTFASGESVDVIPGATITESWIGKRDNDVIWTLSGDTTGQSVFHISCSDDDMNDEGDIGNELGDGKSDDDAYLNDWLLVNMGGDGGTLTDCDTAEDAGKTCKDIKPLDALALTWTDADHNISKITVWGGNDGDTLIDTIERPITAGEQIIVTGLVGDGNDRILELIDQNGVALGSSVFHISCSEDDLDGAEDCGKLVGDGKENSDEYLNLWRFDGMSGEGGNPTDFCTP